MQIIDSIVTELETMIVVTVNDCGTVAVTGYDIDPETGNSMFLEDAKELFLLNGEEAMHLADALAHAENVATEQLCATCHTEAEGA
jgi:hypothetical protein